jgi:hypothetical protein
MEPPIQTEYLRSGGATILTCRRETRGQRQGRTRSRCDKRTFIDEGASAVISFCIRSEIPAYLRKPGESAAERTYLAS